MSPQYLIEVELASTSNGVVISGISASSVSLISTVMLAGPQGKDGAQGAQGAQGIQGLPGAPGPSGPNFLIDSLGVTWILSVDTDGSLRTTAHTPGDVYGSLYGIAVYG